MGGTPEIVFRSLRGIPTVEAGDDLCALIDNALHETEIRLENHDVLVITSKLLSRSEGRFIDLSQTIPSAYAKKIAKDVDKDPRLVEVILQDSHTISRKRPGALIVRHKLGFISANAAVDASNASPKNADPDRGPWVLRMPSDPDATAFAIHEHLHRQHGAHVGVLISDSLGRPFRLGTVGFAVGVAGMSPLIDHRGQNDRFGRTIETTVTAIADQLCAAADLLAGQAGEGRPITHVRGATLKGAGRATDLLRDPASDLYA